MAELTFKGCIVLEKLVVEVNSTWAPIASDLLTDEKAMAGFLQLPNAEKTKRTTWEAKAGMNVAQYKSKMLTELKDAHLHAGNVNNIHHDMIAVSGFLDVVDDIFVEIFSDGGDILGTNSEEHTQRMEEYVERCVEAAKETLNLNISPQDTASSPLKRQFLSKLRLLLDDGDPPSPLLTKSHWEMINSTLAKYPESIKEVGFPLHMRIRD